MRGVTTVASSVDCFLGCCSPGQNSVVFPLRSSGYLDHTVVVGDWERFHFLSFILLWTWRKVFGKIASGLVISLVKDILGFHWYFFKKYGMLLSNFHWYIQRLLGLANSDSWWLNGFFSHKLYLAIKFHLEHIVKLAFCILTLKFDHLNFLHII